MTVPAPSGAAARPPAAHPDMPRAYDAVLPLPSRLTFVRAQHVKHLVLDALEDGARTIRLEARACTFMDSGALGALVSARQQVRRRAGDDGRLDVWNLNPELTALFEIAGLAAVFACYQDDAADR